jgi:hypothetical protein
MEVDALQLDRALSIPDTVVLDLDPEQGPPHTAGMHLQLSELKVADGLRNLEKYS